MLEIARAVERLLLRVTTMGALVVPIGVLPKLRFTGDNLTGTTPVPANEITWGAPAALSLICTDPEEAPRATGENVIVIVQCAAALTLVPQLLVWAKFPVATILEIVKAPVPVLVRVAEELPLV